MFTSVTRAQILVGQEIERAIGDESSELVKEFAETVAQGVAGDIGFLTYCAQQTAEVVKECEEVKVADQILSVAIDVRKSWSLWLDCNYEKALYRISNAANLISETDRKYAGLLFQMAGAIAYELKDYSVAESYQSRAHGLNSNLYHAIRLIDGGKVSEQSKTIVKRVLDRKAKSNYWNKTQKELVALDDICRDDKSHKYEQSLERLGFWLGFESKRYDENGDGPDVFWLLDSANGLAIESKSGRKLENPLNKSAHGQLLNAKEWGKDVYPDKAIEVVSVHNLNLADHNAHATRTKLLSTNAIIGIRDQVLAVLKELFHSGQTPSDLEYRCQTLLNRYGLTPERIVSDRITTFIEKQ